MKTVDLSTASKTLSAYTDELDDEPILRGGLRTVRAKRPSGTISLGDATPTNGDQRQSPPFDVHPRQKKLDLKPPFLPFENPTAASRSTHQAHKHYLRAFRKRQFHRRSKAHPTRCNSPF